MKCEKCSKTSFADLIQYKDEMLCSACYKKAQEQFSDWDNPRLAVSMEIAGETIILPFAENAEKWNDLSVNEAFRELVEEWSAEKWGYYETVYRIELTEVTKEQVEDPKDTVECEEFYGIHAYKELAIKSDLYLRPFEDEPEDAYYSSMFAYDCQYGRIYSKDFAYFQCDDCGRDICEQNPSNGWMSQMHIIGDGAMTICNKCYEEDTLTNGINEQFDGASIPGQFYNYADIEQAGWELVEDSVLAGSGYTGYADPNNAISKIQKLIDEDWLVLVNYESMAIGGLGGYVSIYKKSKKVLA